MWELCASAGHDVSVHHTNNHPGHCVCLRTLYVNTHNVLDDCTTSVCKYVLQQIICSLYTDLPYFTTATG